MTRTPISENLTIGSYRLLQHTTAQENPRDLVMIARSHQIFVNICLLQTLFYLHKEI